MQPLYGHDSQEKSFLNPDYPYGRTVRTQIRFWLETDPKKGTRFCSQTLNPKTNIWNNPKKGTYFLLGACMFLDENGHCTYSGISQYSRAEEVLNYLEQFPQAPVSDLLRFFITGRLKVTATTTRGEAVISINNVPQVPSEYQIAEAVTEKSVWTKAQELVKGR